MKYKLQRQPPTLLIQLAPLHNSYYPSHSIMTAVPSIFSLKSLQEETFSQQGQDQSAQTSEDYLQAGVWQQIFPQYNFLELIAETQSSLIWLGSQRNSVERLALKLTETTQKGSSAVIHQQAQKSFVTEHRLKFMVNIIDIKEAKDYRLMVMQYYPWSLADILNHYTNLSRRYTQSHFQFVVFAFRGILAAVQELHALGYVHRDLKLDNFMVDTDFNIYLNDFELVTKELEVDSSLSGTLEYMAPERISKRRFSDPITKAVDVWSLGIMLYELFTGETPFNGSSSNQILDEIYQGYLRDKEIPIQVRNSIKGMLNIRSEKRPTLEEIRNNNFFQKDVTISAIKAMMSH